MLGAIRRLFSPRPDGHDFSLVEAWARKSGHGFKRARTEDGFVVDGQHDGRPWRIEWGPSQRDYIDGHELRLRVEIELRSDAQMLLLSRPLMDVLERQTFEEFTDSVQTQIGDKTPEEMRWLVMFPKVDLGGLKNLRGHYGAVASTPATGLAWIDGPLAQALSLAQGNLLRDSPPFVLITLRGRIHMRLGLRTPDVERIGAAVALFETAVAQAVRAASDSSDRSTEWGHSADSAWQSLRPDDGADPRRRR